MSIRRYWLPQLIALLLVAVLGTVPFWLTDLDILVASLFYHPEADDPWFEAQQPPWSFFYVAAPLMAGFVMLGGLFVLAAGAVSRRFRRVKLVAVFITATAVLGPGLIVNGVFKDNWGRPRPNQVAELGGTGAYLPPLMRGEPGKGKSFPSGHASVGYMLGAFFMVWLRRRPALAWSALAGSVFLGTLIGVGRMAAGDHFLSDVIWAWVIAFGIAWLLYYPLLRVPWREDASAGQPEPPMRPLSHPVLTAGAYGIAALVMIVLVLSATPVAVSDRELIRPGELDPDPTVLRIIADQGDLVFFWPGGEERTAVLMLKARGFGLPGAHVVHQMTAEDGVLTYRLTHSGYFTEKNTQLAVGLVPQKWTRVEARTGSGDILVYPHQVQLPTLELHTDDGVVTRLAP